MVSKKEPSMNNSCEQHKASAEAPCFPTITEAQGYFGHLNQILQLLPYETVDQIVRQLLRAYEANRMIFTFGNGGSASLASHMACDLGKGTSVAGLRRLRVMSLTDNIALMTAWANDAKYDDIFAEQLRNWVEPDDVVLAISGSGNSPNVLNGLRTAREAGCYIIGLTGFQGGKMKDLCDLCLVVPSDNMQFIEDLHVCVSHCVFTAVRHQLSIKSNLSVPRAAYACAAG
jgi:D-sedoheptulose 7-phosphate isomerase